MWSWCEKLVRRMVLKATAPPSELSLGAVRAQARAILCSGSSYMAPASRPVRGRASAGWTVMVWWSTMSPYRATAGTYPTLPRTARSWGGPSEARCTPSDSGSEAQVTDDEDMFNLRSEATALRRAARARTIRHRRAARHADTTFGEYATYSPLIRWGPHGYARDGLPYVATNTDTARRIDTPVSVMAIPLSRAELSRVSEVLLHTPAPQRVLFSITDPDERQRPIQILAGSRLDPPCSDRNGVRCPRRSPLHFDPAPRDACDIHGPTRRVAATFRASHGHIPNILTGVLALSCF